MNTRGALIFTSRLLLLLAVAAAADAGGNTAGASDESVRSYFRSVVGAREPDVTGTVNARAAAVPPTAAVRYAQAARARFNDARAAVERGLILRETTPATNVAALESAMAELLQDLKMLSAAGRPLSESARRASSLAQEWHEAGLKILKPPAGGVLELPTTLAVENKAEATAAAFDELIKEANAVGPARATGSSKRRQHANSRSGAAGDDPVTAFGALRETLH
jgi:hypothetical protein